MIETVFDQLIDNIALFLELKDLFHLLAVNRKYHHILANDRFWRCKIKRDYRIKHKNDNQKWIDRYKLASAMGQILIKDLCNNPPVNFDIGFELKIKHFNNARLLPYRAITAILIRPCIYYIDDNYNLYMVGEPHYAGHIYKIPELLDINVIILEGGPYDFFYLKEGDIYHYTADGKKQITNRHDIIDFSFCYPFISYITTAHELYQVKHDDDIDKWVLTDQVQKDIIKVLQYADTQLFVNKYGQLKTDHPGLDCSSLNNIINIYGGFLFATRDGKLISINIKQPSEGYEMGDKYDYYFQEEFPEINDVTGARVSYHISTTVVRTKKGEIVLKTDSKIVKLNIKAKNICYSPENIIFII